MAGSERIDLIAITEKLNRSPIFHMSLGSKELFHSNFIAWLLMAYPDAANCFDIDVTKPFSVIREQHNIDLALKRECEPPFCIIENKFKDIPRRAQLERYADKSPAHSRVLLTLVPASFDVTQIGWQQVLYADFADRLNGWLNQNQNVSFRDREFVASYCEMTSAIASIADAVFVAPSQVRDKIYWFGLTDEWRSRLDEIRFLDTISKHSADEMQLDLEHALRLGLPDLVVNPDEKQEKDLQRSGVKFCKTWSALFNKQPCVTVELHRWIASNQFNLTIQIQGNQYRRLIDCDYFRIPRSQSAVRKKFDARGIIEASDDYRWLFDPDIHNGTVNITTWNHIASSKFRTTMRKPFGTYAPKAIYQYITISDTPGGDALNANKVMASVIADVRFGLELLDDEQYVQSFANLKQ